MKKDLFDLLKQFIFENAERYEVSPIGEGIIKITYERPDDDRRIVQADLDADLLSFSYYDEGEEHILIASTLSRIDGEDEEIYITKTKDDISIDISINKK